MSATEIEQALAETRAAGRKGNLSNLAHALLRVEEWEKDLKKMALEAEDLRVRLLACDPDDHEEVKLLYDEALGHRAPRPRTR